MHTALTKGTSTDELTRIRARNALKILLDVHGDIGRAGGVTGVIGRGVGTGMASGDTKLIEKMLYPGCIATDRISV